MKLTIALASLFLSLGAQAELLSAEKCNEIFSKSDISKVLIAEVDKVQGVAQASEDPFDLALNMGMSGGLSGRVQMMLNWYQSAQAEICESFGNAKEALE